MEGPALSTITPRGKETVSKEVRSAFEKCIEQDASSGWDLELREVTQGVYYIDNVLTEAECASLRLLIDDSSFLSFWCADKKDDPSTRSFRNAETIEMNSDKFAELLWSRVQGLLSKSLPDVLIEDDPDNEDYERDLVGKWVACGTNPFALFARYPSFGSFAPHTDGRAIIDFNRRSHYSIVIYLNSVPLEMGAGTRFYDKEAVNQLKLLPDIRSGNTVSQWTADKHLVKAEVEAVAGRMAFFHQSWVHEGVPPVAPYLKYIIRSDIIFQRNPAVCDTPTDKEAYELFRKAEELAEMGNSSESIKLFKQAFRLSRSLARIMGQA